MVDVVVGDDGEHRPEDLLPGDAHAVVDAGEHRHPVAEFSHGQRGAAQVVGRSVDESARQAAGVSADVLTDGASRDSGGVDAAQYATEAGTTTLDGQAGSEAAATLAAKNAALDARPTPGNERSDAVRSQEEITLVIDRHKGQLQALYNRARRSNPALKGKLVLSISIAPDGSVTDAEIVSSELNDRALEARILARIKTLQFGARPVPAVTVSYPIEFLP